MTCVEKKKIERGICVVKPKHNYALYIFICLNIRGKLTDIRAAKMCSRIKIILFNIHLINIVTKLLKTENPNSIFSIRKYFNENPYYTFIFLLLLFFFQY